MLTSKILFVLKVKLSLSNISNSLFISHEERFQRGSEISALKSKEVFELTRFELAMFDCS